MYMLVFLLPAGLPADGLRSKPAKPGKRAE